MYLNGPANIMVVIVIIKHQIMCGLCWYITVECAVVFEENRKLGANFDMCQPRCPCHAVPHEPNHFCSYLHHFDSYSCSYVWSQGPGNMSMVCLGWCMTTCTGWLFPSECSTSLLWQSLIVFGTELQSTSPTTVCQSLNFLVASICDLPDVINYHFCKFAIVLLGAVHFLSLDQQSGIHCLIICTIQLLTRNNFGGTWRCIRSPDIQSVSALEVLYNHALQIDIYLLTYIHTVVYTWSFSTYHVWL